VVPAGIVASSVKVNWTPDELAGVAVVAAKPVRLFDSIDEAHERYRKVAGLTSDITDAPEDLERGVSPSGPHYRLSQDPAAGNVGEPDVSGALAAAQCPVWLLRGVADRMVGDAELSALGVPVVTLPDAGHNVHVEQPRLFAHAVLDVVVGV
jgi:pimeloyl-ACP methyl ester carboxylesterase